MNCANSFSRISKDYLAKNVQSVFAGSMASAAEARSNINSSTMGRFMSPDPKLENSSYLADPQKWNKYTYVLNNPIVYFDPNGQEEKTFLGKVLDAVYVKVGLGLGLGVNAKALNVKGKVEASSKLETKISLNGNVDQSLVNSAQVGVEAKAPGIGEVSIGPKVSQSTPITKDNETVPSSEQKPEPAEKSMFIELKGNESSGSSGDITLAGAGICVLVCVSADIGVDVTKVKAIFQDPGPPPPPNPPSPLPPIQPAPSCNVDPNRKC
jgi:hypothetical protein